VNNVGLLTIFMLSIFVGFEVISKVSAVLHTPLMSGANAIHGIILVGAILITGTSSGGVQLTLGLVAVVLATANMVGGFVVTDRMLEMFKGRGKAAKATSKADAASKAGAASGSTAATPGSAPVTPAANAATDRPAS
jgi:H+-translocating NAD(P) transhydrogenase subunit alpha